MIRFDHDAVQLPSRTVRYFREFTGSQPVRDWLKRIEVEEMREIGTAIKTVQSGWRIGLPV